MSPNRPPVASLLLSLVFSAFLAISLTGCSARQGEVPPEPIFREAPQDEIYLAGDIEDSEDVELAAYRDWCSL